MNQGKSKSDRRQGVGSDSQSRYSSDSSYGDKYSKGSRNGYGHPKRATEVDGSIASTLIIGGMVVLLLIVCVREQVLSVARMLHRKF